ncbi:MAG: 2-amino-4-hydroxy-6-hydroxymethyldihydropteridine diphosphokinase [Bacteroidota bacterium]
MHKAYLLLGSNIGDSKKNIAIANKEIEKQIGKTLRSSSVYATAAWGNKDQPDFLNQIIIINTIHEPLYLLQLILAIEKKMGRIRTQKNAPRTIDIDILFFDKLIINQPNLIIPHPLISERNFVLVPMNELSPQFIHPHYNKTIHEMLLKCKDRLTVKKN